MLPRFRLPLVDVTQLLEKCFRKLDPRLVRCESRVGGFPLILFRAFSAELGSSILDAVRPKWLHHGMKSFDGTRGTQMIDACWSRCGTTILRRAGLRGIQEWLSFYFKSPMCAPQLYPEHDLFIQSMKLKNTLRWIMGEDLITHLGAEYYD